MTEEKRKAELARLEKLWQDETRKIKRYAFLLEGARERRSEIEKAIRKV